MMGPRQEYQAAFFTNLAFKIMFLPVICCGPLTGSSIYQSCAGIYEPITAIVDSPRLILN